MMKFFIIFLKMLKSEAKIVNFKIRVIINRIKNDHVGAYAAQMAYFIILAFIPFVLFMTTIVRYTPFSYDMVKEFLIGAVPLSLQHFVLNIMTEIYNRSSTVLPVSAATALWTAGKGIQAMIRGMNTIYQVKETRNWLINRIYSVIYMSLFSAAIVIVLIILVLGNEIKKLFLEYMPMIGQVMEVILETRILLVFGLLFLVFLMLYKVLPNRTANYKSQVPGAAFTAAAWMIFSFGFSLYFTYSPGIMNMYGSLTARIMLMLWLYICMYLTLIGAEINVWFEKKLK